MRIMLLLSLFAAPMVAQGQITGGNCSAGMLTGTYSYTMTGRAVSTSSILSADFMANGTATFDGVSKVSMTITSNTLTVTQKQSALTGTFTVASNCTGTIALTGGITANLNLILWNGGSNFAIDGSDTTYAYAGTGNPIPASCVTASLSGAYAYTATGFDSSATGSVNGASDEAGLLQLDGQGNVTYSYTISGVGAPVQSNATGTYTLTSACIGTGTLTDANGKAIAMNFVVTTANATSFNVIESSSGFIRTGTAHSVFLNPAQSIGNVSSYAVNSTPPGSVFVIFGSNLATTAAGAQTSTLPTSLIGTSVLVNGAAAPLFYVDKTQIDVQMPWTVPGDALATIQVKNGTAVSNAASVFVPATGTPGISVYGDNRAVVVNQSGTVNSSSAAANVGDEVVAYFTGGGPVNSTGKLVSGTPAPSGLSPVTGTNTVTVNGVSAKVLYMGLTPGSIGLYQANFVVPTVAKGTYALVIDIAGQDSNKPLITVN
jgi:uncharacterized protein (TIGR03437 family)